MREATATRNSTYRLVPDRLRWPAAVGLLTLTVTIVLLRAQGRRWWCACERWFLWSSDTNGPHNSQHLLDPYSFTHMTHGLLLYGLFALILSRQTLWWRLILVVGIECGWEVLENSSIVIERYRAATVSLGYEGDSVGNSVGDVFCCVVGFWMANRLGLWKSVAVGVAAELLLLGWIRDNLTLNVVMLLYPLDGIRAWQQAG